MNSNPVEHVTATRNWTLREDNNSHYHNVVSLSESPLYLELSWRKSATEPVNLVGVYRLNLHTLLEGGYIRHEGEGTTDDVRLRVVRDQDRFFIQVRSDGPRVELPLPQ